MAAASKATGQRNKRMWPVGKSNKEIDRTIAGANELANAQGNVGDSLESRLTNMMLGGGTDMMGGYTVDERTGNSRSSPFSKKGRSETKIAWTKIKLVRDIYDNDGQVASIVDLMADFATEGVNFIHEDKGAQNFYQAWCEKVKIRQKVRRSVIDLLISGTVFLYKVYAKLNDSEKRSMRRLSKAERIGNKFLITDEEGNEDIIDPKIEYDSICRMLLDPEKKQSDAQFKKTIKTFVAARLKSQGEKIVDKKIKDGEKNVVPWKYISMNPLQMRPNQEGGWSYLLSKVDLMALAGKVGVTINENTKTLKVALPDGLAGTIRPIKDVEAAGFFAEMILDTNRLVVIPWNKYDWAKWGSPGGLVWKAMPTITFKNTLRRMEQKNAEAAINMVYLWKLGDHENGLVPTLEDYERFADMLKAPASTLNILWNSAIEGQVIQPKLGDIFDPTRWEGLRAELTSQFGITQAIITGEGGNFSSSFISVQGLLERLQSIRDLLIEEWLRPEALQIKEAMGFQKMPKIVFNQMSLRDKAAENTFLMALYDRGIVSDETMYEALDKDVTVERSRIAEQEEYLAENDMAKKGPFDANKDQLDFQKESKQSDDEFRKEQFEETKKQNEEKNKVDMEKAKNPPAPTQPGGTGGKPKGPAGPQKKKRESKPKNIARLDVETMVKQFDVDAKAALCDSEAVRDYRSLSKVSKENVDVIVLSSLAKQASNEQAMRLIFEENRAAFVSANEKQPTKAELHKIMIDSFIESHGV